MAAKQVTVYLSRDFTLMRHDKEEVRLTKGANVVDADVAEHAFIKALSTAPSQDAANVSELESQVADLTAQLDAAKKQNADLQAALDAMSAAMQAPATTGKK